MTAAKSVARGLARLCSLHCGALVWGALLWTVACGPHLPPAYSGSVSAARAAYERGQYELAAQYWADAESAAPNARERDECLYRRAVSLQRAGKTARAQELLRELGTRTGSDRAARARFDHATALIESNRADAGYTELLAAVVEYPNSGLAPKATLRLLEREEQRGGVAAALKLIATLEARVKPGDLHEVLLYERAKLVERSRGAAAALPEFRALIVRYPYPEGSYWDESILRAARLERQLGRPERAIEWLRFLLKHREESNFMGSYERHYSQAHWLLAEITRDDLRQPARARAEFRRLFERYETSLLRDDALWEASRISHQLAEHAETCDDVARLLQQFPDSRHADDARKLCPNASTGD